MYVGSSTYPSKRVFTHDRCQGKDFAAVWFLPVDEAERLATERHWIRTTCPVHNKAHNPRPDPASPGWGGDPDCPTVTVNLDGEIVRRARVVAACRQISVPEYLSRCLLNPVDADYELVVAEMVKEVGLTD